MHSTVARAHEPFVSRPLPDPLKDAQGRVIAYLRLSLTDRCNFRCDYCSVSDYDDPGAVLTRPEIARLVGIFARLGVRRVRLTGGEPTLRKEVVAIAADVRARSDRGGRHHHQRPPAGRAGAPTARRRRGLRERVARHAPAERLLAISGEVPGSPTYSTASTPQRPPVRARQAQHGGDGGVNDDELGELVRHAWARKASPRFIELMPFGKGCPCPPRA